MDIGKAFSYVFDDEHWISKVLIGGLLIWIPIVNFAVFGYMIKIAQNVAQGNPHPLPEWGEFGDHFMRGFYVFVIYLVYLLPIFILEGLFFCVTGGLAAGSRRGEGGAAAALLGLCLVPRALRGDQQLERIVQVRRGDRQRAEQLYPLADAVAGVDPGGPGRWIRCDRLWRGRALYRLLCPMCGGPRARPDGGPAAADQSLCYPADAADRQSTFDAVKEYTRCPPASATRLRCASWPTPPTYSRSRDC